jgi:hypothetical protein
MGGAILMALPTIGEGHSSAAGVGMIMAALVSYGFALNLARPLQWRNGALPVIWRPQMVALVLTKAGALPGCATPRLLRLYLTASDQVVTHVARYGGIIPG